MVYAFSIHIISGYAPGPVKESAKEDDMEPKEKIIFALDVEHFEEAQKLVMEFKEHVGMFKVGKQLFTHCGPKIVDFINMKNSKVFLDLKYHDIPNTVAKAVIEAAQLGVELVNVHASGGFTMMKDAAVALHDAVRTRAFTNPRSSALPYLQVSMTRNSNASVLKSP
jgi:orotidine-5'-phosphate decarboxylase